MADEVGRKENTPEKTPSGSGRFKIALEQWNGQAVPGTDMGQERDSTHLYNRTGRLNRSISR